MIASHEGIDGPQDGGTGIIPPPLMWLGGGGMLVVLAVAGWVIFRPDVPPKHGSVRDDIRVADHAVTLAPDTPMRQFIGVETAREQPGLAPIPCPGRVTFDERRTSTIGTPLPGRVEEVAVRPGDAVEPGAHLVSVRSGALADVEHEIEEAQNQLGVKRRIADRTRALVELQTAAAKDQLAADADVKEAELALQTALAHRDSLRVSPAALNVFWITAPRAGSVVELDVAPSAQVTPEREQPLLRIADLGEVVVVADVQERDAADLHAGDTVEVRAQGGTLVRSGTVEHLSAVVDPARRTLEARVRVQNADGQLRPNAFVEVATPAAKTMRVRIPAEAVLTDGDERVVLRQEPDRRLVRTPVTLGRERGGEVEILSGLRAGDQYVSRGAILLLNEIALAE